MSLMSLEKLQAIIEAALMIANRPLSIAAIQQLFNEDERPNAKDIRNVLDQLSTRLSSEESGITLQEVSSGFRIQAKAELSPWLSKLFEERAPKYSRAFLETLAIIAYKQPITRAEIEEIRGVTVSSNIMKTLQEREWIRIIGHRDVPGKPGIYGTTKTFLDYFNLKSLTDLPSLAEFKDLATQEAQLNIQLALDESSVPPNNSELIPEEQSATLDDHGLPLHESHSSVSPEVSTAIALTSEDPSASDAMLDNNNILVSEEPEESDINEVAAEINTTLISISEEANASDSALEDDNTLASEESDIDETVLVTG